MNYKYIKLLTCAGFFVFIGTAAAIPPPPPSSSIEFAVLGGSAVTLTNSAVKGDVGVDLGGAFTSTSSTVTGTVHVGDTVAQQGYDQFLLDYDAIAAMPGTDLTGQSLSGMFLTPGVYTFDAAVTETGGLLTLVGNSDDTWIFKIGTGGTGALTGTNFTVVMTNGEECNNNVIWWTAEAATLTDSVFIGSLYAGTSITVTRGSLDGSALAKSAVTLTGTTVCGPTARPLASFVGKVTGGGQIGVPNADSRSQATFGFNAKGNLDGSASGHFNYVNHATGLQINGPVQSMVVTVINEDGSPDTVRFSGTSGGNSFFTVTVQDNGEPGRTDQFGITVTGALTEVQSQRIIRKGNIQLH